VIDRRRFERPGTRGGGEEEEGETVRAAGNRDSDFLAGRNQAV